MIDQKSTIYECCMKTQILQRAYRSSQSACAADVSREFLLSTRKNVLGMFLRSLKILSWRPFRPHWYKRRLYTCCNTSYAPGCSGMV